MTKNISQDRQRDETWTRDDLQNAQLECFNNFHESQKQSNKYKEASRLLGYYALYNSNYLPINTAQHPRLLESSGRLLWEPQISQRRDCWIQIWSVKREKNEGRKQRKREKKRWEQRNNKNKQWLIRKDDVRKTLTSSCHSLPECCSPTAASALGSLHIPIWNKTRFHVSSAAAGQDSRYSPQKFCTTG